MVAKSFQSFEQLGEPYEVSGKMYVRVRNNKTGNERQVRWYTDKEYAKLYPNEKTAATQPQSSQKEALGFQEGYIIIFKGDAQAHLEWFQEKKECRYTRLWGWYIISTEQVPTDLPTGITAVRLYWENVGLPSGALKPETAVTQAVEELLYDSGSSEWIGKIGERLELTLTVTSNHSVENAYGTAHIHYFEDAEGNLFGWVTNAKNWAVGEIKTIKGTIKSHETLRNQRITWLTRCMEVN